MRAEDFFGFAKRMKSIEQGLVEDLRAIEDDPHLSEIRAAMAKQAAAGQLGAIRGRYGAGVDARSHGEGFIALFQARFLPDGLYLLDEPEAPLSPARQLGLLALIADGVAQGAQFIIATHSPIVMAYPGATIYRFDADGGIHEERWADLEHVTLTRDFLVDPDLYLRHLLPNGEG